MKTLIYSLLASVLLSACSCKKNDTATYTLSGQYLEDCNLKPKANNLLQLEDASSGKVIAETTTNSEGSFKLNFEAHSGSLNLVDPIKDEIIYESVPNNTNHNQVVFEENFVLFKINLDIRDSSLIGDTFYLSLLQDGGCTKNWSLINTSWVQNVGVTYLVISDTQNQTLEVYAKIGLKYQNVSYDLELKNSGWAWGIGLQDFDKSINSGLTINGTQIYPDNYHRFTIDHSPYPAVNEYTLVIE